MKSYKPFCELAADKWDLIHMHSFSSGIPVLFRLIHFFSLPCFWISEIKSSSFMGFVTSPPIKNILNHLVSLQLKTVSYACLIPNAHFLSGRGCLKARHHKYFLYNTKLMFCRAEMPGAESWDFCLPILTVNVCAVWKVTLPLVPFL